MSKLLTISELSRKLKLIDAKNKPQNYVLRFWETKFTQIKPKIVNKRRYYSNNQVEIIKLIYFLLKEKGMTIEGAKNILKNNSKKLDEYNSDSLKATYIKNNIKIKSKLVLDKIKNLKRYGKKNTH